MHLIDQRQAQVARLQRTWQIDTDRGATELVLKVEEDIRRLPGAKRLLVTSGNGVVFEIRDRQRLERASQRLLERFF